MKQLLTGFLLLFSLAVLAQSDPTQRLNNNLSAAGAYKLYPKSDSIKLANLAVSGTTSGTGLQAQINALNAAKLNLTDSSKFVNKLSGYQLLSPAEITKLTLIDTSSTLLTKLNATSKLAAKVDKVVGKDLSTNDYTNTDKALLATHTTQIASLSATYQPETIDYVTRIVGVGGQIPHTQISAVDRFVLRGKRVGWWSVLKEIYPFLGSNLASSLVKLKYATVGGGTSSFTTSGTWNETNYDPYLGICASATTTNSGNYLNSNYTLSTDGVSAGSMSYGVYLTSQKRAIGGGLGLISMIPSSATIASGYYIDQLNVGYVAIGGNVQRNISAAAGQHLYSSSGGISYIMDNGVANIADGYPATLTPDGVWNLFSRANTGGTRAYTNGDIGFAFVGSGLTRAQAIDLQLAIEELMGSVGRRSAVKPNHAFFGVSVTGGTGASTQQNATNAYRFPRIIADRLGVNEVNVGSPTSCLTAKYGVVESGLARYPDLLSRPIDAIWIDYGVNDEQLLDATTNGDATISTAMQTSLTTVISGLQTAGINRIIVGGLYYTTTPNATKMALYTSKIAAAAKARGVPFADLYRYMLDAGGVTTQPGDGTHPGDFGHAVIAQAYLDAYNGIARRRVTLDFPSVSAGSYQDLTITIMNAVPGSSQGLSYVTPTPEAGIVYSAVISANDTITIRATNISASPVDPASGTYQATLTF